MTNQAIAQSIKTHVEAMIAFRRDLHAHPELPWEEVRTTQKVAQALEEIGIPYRLTTPTGVIAEITGGQPGKTVALRADMDALPVQELNDSLSYKSQTDGKMHAQPRCPHRHAADGGESPV